MKPYYSMLLGLSCLLSASSAHAARLDFIASTASPIVGSNFSVDMYIALDQGTPSSGYLAAYDLDLSFNASRLQLNGVSFDFALGEVALGETLQTVDSQTGLVNISELSLLEESVANCVFCVAPYLADLQQSPLVKLASFSFTAIDIGSADFAVSLNAIGDAYGNVLPTNVGSFPAAMQVSSVPVPSAVWLFLGGMPILMRRWRQSSDT